MQTAENLFEHGLIDAILPAEALAETADRALNVLLGPREDLPDVPELVREALPDLPAWDSIVRSRRDDRPGVRALLRHGATDVLPLHGTGQGEYDPGLLLALARFGGAPCIVLGQDRRGQTLDEPLSAQGLRVARRGCRWPASSGCPSSASSTPPGAALSKEAEEGGLAGEIARCLAELVTLEAPTLCVLLGQGTGGGALALMPADRVICAQHAWLSPLPPEGASAILHRDTAHAPELAAEPAACARSTCSPTASSTGSSPSTRTPRTSRRTSAGGWARPSSTTSPCSPGSHRATGSRRGRAATVGWPASAGRHVPDERERHSGIHLPRREPALGRRCQRADPGPVPRLTPTTCRTAPGDPPDLRKCA